MLQTSFNIIKKYFLFSLLAISFIIAANGYAFAQTLQIPGLFGEQKTKTSSVKLSANDLMLIWSANTYVPPAYTGKALPTYDSPVKVSVIPITKAGLSAPKLIYRWYLDGRFDQYNSGENRLNYLFKTSASAGSRQYIEVKILDKEEIELFTLSTSIPVSAPQIAIIQNDRSAPNADIFGSLSLIVPFGQEGIFAAIPYFFDIASLNFLTYQWNFDNNNVTKTEEKNKFSIKAPEGDASSSFKKFLGVTAINPLNDIQRATNSIEITFKK